MSVCTWAVAANWLHIYNNNQSLDRENIFLHYTQVNSDNWCKTVMHLDISLQQDIVPINPITHPELFNNICKIAKKEWEEESLKRAYNFQPQNIPTNPAPDQS